VFEKEVVFLKLHNFRSLVDFSTFHCRFGGFLFHFGAFGLTLQRTGLAHPQDSHKNGNASIDGTRIVLVHAAHELAAIEGTLGQQDRAQGDAHHDKDKGHGIETSRHTTGTIAKAKEEVGQQKSQKKEGQHAVDDIPKDV